jgi:GR25 family glycosyltransferase involved in LPS biosynthesis
VYVIHYTPRTWRRPRMMARIAAIGVPTAPSKGVLNFVDDFDADNFTAEETQCLREGRGRRLATTRSHVPRHVPRRKKVKSPLLTPAQLSVNAKHYAAMLDMLRHGVRYAMIVEDDAAFETGSKIDASAKNKTYDVLAKYPGSTSFNETLLKYIEPHLPTLTRKPAGFGGAFGEEHAGDDPHAAYIFDHLSFGACDMYWDKVYTYGMASGADLPQTNLRKQVTSLESSHVSRSDWSCTRCLISYVSSLSGATRFLEARALPWVASIDIHLTWASGTKVSEGRPADCLWVEPPIVWEDPGAEGDGLVDAARLHRPPAAPAARTAGIGVYP